MGHSKQIVTCADCGEQKQHMGRGYCAKCYARARRRDFTPPPVIEPPSFVGDERLPPRFWRKVEVQENGCWHWTGCLSRPGYGRITVDGAKKGVHRHAYETLVGPIPAGLQIDHHCHNLDHTCEGGDSCLHRRCVNVAHLRAVTPAVNTLAGNTLPAKFARAETCAEGHELSGGNLIVKGNGCRKCRKCQRQYHRDYRARKRAEVPAA